MTTNNKNGYAIMFTVILVSIISLIGIGLSNTTYKQLLLSSGAKDSQTAFYMSDMATECALYVDNVLKVVNEGVITYPAQFNCGIDNNGDNYELGYNFVNPVYTFELLNPSSDEPCFNFQIEKLDDGARTTITASGYNICDTSNSRTVERTIEVTY